MDKETEAQRTQVTKGATELPASLLAAYHEDAFPGHPPDGQHCPALHTIIIPSVEVSAHAKVSNFDGEIFPNQAVPGGQVSMYKVECGQITHA